MTQMSYVDNSVDFGDFFSRKVEEEEKSRQYSIFLILQVMKKKYCKKTNMVKNAEMYFFIQN